LLKFFHPVKDTKIPANNFTNVLLQASGSLFDDLSEQFLVDCAYNHYFGEWGAFGCNGAWPQAYFDYLETVSGGRMQTEQSYPYTASDGQCRQTEQGEGTH
jgi:hypothetical protein